MLADFIEVNGFSARIISFENAPSIERACQSAKVSEDCAAKALVFVDERMDFFVVAALAQEEVSIDDAEHLFGVFGLESADPSDTYKLTGFAKESFSPIGVFDAKVMLASAAKKRKTLVFAVSEKDFLVISPKEIEKAAELAAQL